MKNNETTLRLIKKVTIFEVLFIMISILLYSLCCPVLNLNDCYDVRYDGHNGEGIAVVVDVTNRVPRGIYAIAGYTDFPLSKNTWLSNGDTIILDFDISLKERLELLFEWGIRVRGKSETFTVEGLPELVEIDPFKQKDLTLNFIGVKDSTNVFVDMDYKIKLDYDKEYEDGMSLNAYNKHKESTDNQYKSAVTGEFYIDYSLVEGDGLNVGDEVIVTYEYDEEILKEYGQKITTSSQTYIIEEPTCYYVQNITDLSDDGFTDLIRTVTGVSRRYDGEIEYYFFKAKKPDLEKDYNFIYLIYKYENNDFYHYQGSNGFYYDVVKISNICMKEDGSFVDFGKRLYKPRIERKYYETYIDGCTETKDCRANGCLKEELIELFKDYDYVRGITMYSSSRQTVYHNRLLETTTTE